MNNEEKFRERFPQTAKLVDGERKRREKQLKKEERWKKFKYFVKALKEEREWKEARRND